MHYSFWNEAWSSSEAAKGAPAAPPARPQQQQARPTSSRQMRPAANDSLSSRQMRPAANESLHRLLQAVETQGQQLQELQAHLATPQPEPTHAAPPNSTSNTLALILAAASGFAVGLLVVVVLLFVLSRVRRSTTS